MTGRAAVILTVLALSCAAAVLASEGLHIAGTEPAEHALSVDTPTRLAQRSRVAERAAAVEAAARQSSDAEDEGEAEAEAEGEAQTETDRALDAALVETGAVAHDRSRGRTRGRQRYVPGPAWSRLTGASKTYHPNDQMCVLCQFLVERTQLDLAHFNTMGNFLGARNAAGGSATAAATGGVGKGAGESAFLQIAEGDEAEEAAEAEAEDEAEDESESAEADWEAEDAKEAAALEISAREQLAESDGDWETAAQLDDAVKALHKDAHRNDEDAEEAEETDAEETTNEQSAAAPAEASLAEVSAAEALTAAEKAEFDEVMREFHDEKVIGAVQQQLDAAMTPQTVERDASAADDAEEDAALIQVSESEDAEDDSEDEGEAEADAEDELELDNESDSESEDAMNEEEVTPEMVSNGERADLMEALGETFDQEINLDADEKSELTALRTPAADSHGLERPDWGMPTYNADGQAEEDTTSITTEARDVEAGAEGEESMIEAAAAAANSDADAEERSNEAYRVEFVGEERAPNGQGRREYAKLLHRAEEAPVLAEMQSHAFLSDGGRARTRQRSREIPRYAPAPLGVGVANSPRRFRLSDALLSRPNWNRFDPTIKPHPNAQRTAAREMWNKLLHMTYDRLEGYCSTRLPEQFTPFCRPMLKRFRVIAEGLRYGDRPNQICMRTRFCPRGSYVRRSPHNVFKHVQV